MISFFRRHPACGVGAEFRFVNLFEEVTEYDRTFQLPFNILSCVVDSDPGAESYIRSNITGEIYPHRDGEIIFIPRGLPIFIHRKPDFRILSLHFTWEAFPGMDLFAGSETIHRLEVPETGKRIERYFAEPDPVIACYGLQAIVLELCLPLIPANRNLAEKWRFAEIPKMVRRSVSAQMSVADLAQMAHLSVPAFSREFSSVMHCSAKEFLQNELLARALHLMHDPKKKIREISEELGFSSPYYFSKFFKRRYGISPSFHRERERKRCSALSPDSFGKF